jgi:hypothetical protein
MRCFLRLVSGIAVLMLIAAACSDSDREEPTASPNISASAVRDATLTIEDMPDEWSELKLSDDPNDFVRIGGQFSALDVTPVARAAVAFREERAQATVPVGFITNTVVLTDSADEARESMARLKRAAETEEWQQDFDQGLTTYRLTPLALEPLGDETFAVRLSATQRSRATGEDIDFARDAVYYRIGPVFVFVGVQLADTVGYARKSESRVRQLVSGSLN